MLLDTSSVTDAELIASSQEDGASFALGGFARLELHDFSVANSRYTSAELGYTGSYYGMLRARSTSAGTWEKFRTRPA